MATEHTSSLSNASEVTTQSATIELFLSFAEQKIYSKVTYSLLVLSLSLSKITFDTLNLKVKSVSTGTFALGDPTASLGTPLIITLSTPLTQGTEFPLSIESECGADSPGLIWMAAAQTSGKTHPFVFTQFEPIYCRSLIPVQDVPSVKFTVIYKITVPKPLHVVTAALQIGEETLVPGHTTYTSNMKYPIPAYLVAFAAGDITYRDISPRCRIYAEPEVVDAAAWEFEDTDKMLTTAEGLLTPYEWGKYDILVLPPAFPYGGMENPTLTFMTPTVIAGDRSLVSIVAHEMSHSWAGNLVTNKSWQHFYLNEGLTTYLENAIMRELLGNQATELLIDNQIKALETFVREKMSTHPEETRLNPDLGDNNPDDTYSIVPYYKGMCFFVHLEQLVGGKSEFFLFLRDYFHHFAFKSLDSSDFMAYFAEKFPGIAVDWELWLHGEGMPAVIPTLTLIDAVKSEIQALLDRFEDENYQPQACDIANWSLPQVTMFLKRVGETPKPQHLRMSEAYKLSETGNYELKYLWCCVVVKLQAKEYYQDVWSLLSSQGRMKFIRPIFSLLTSSSETDLAKSIYQANKASYSLIVQRLLTQAFPYLAEVTS